MKGSTYKRCGCRNPVTGRQYRPSCPKLKKKDHGSWWGRYDLPRGADGKRRQEKIGPYATRAEAEAALAEAVDGANKGTNHGVNRQTFGDYLDQWIAGKVGLSENTRKGYLTHIRLYYRPGLGHVRMSDLRDHHFEELYAAMRQIGRLADGVRPSPMLRRLLEARTDTQQARRPLSASRIKRIHATATSALNSAVRRKRIPFNPAEHVELVPPRRRRPLVWTAERIERWQQTGRRPAPVMVWTPQQTGAFLDFVADDTLYALWHLLAYRPLRRGEVAGLPWSDVDLAAGTLLVRETNPGHVPGDEDDWDDPKSDAGERTVTLDDQTVQVLRAYKKRQSEMRLALGTGWVDSGRVFTKETGEALSPDGISQRFDRFLTRHATIRRRHTEDGWSIDRLARAHAVPERAILTTLQAPLPPIRLHDLRHGAASLMLAAGVDINVVKEECGHATAAFTRDFYQHVFPEVAKAAAEAVAAIVPRSALGK
ncbi:site-specific integrase [Planobispora rosea]|uniref:Site-specific integrase n=1 Tax=Planobispora rosea TaxID=35762 RepID=A0A8J3S8C2_PLARO|nr:site-specific integrase [Planobispora rosea]GIH87861.1 site-specific integrase [Planobispora rosea]